MLAKYPSTPWFIFLQDDAVLKIDEREMFPQTLKTLVEQQASPISKLNHRGNVALMFNRYYLQSFASYALLRYDQFPIDWLLDLHMKQVLGKPPPIHHYFAHVGSKSTFAKNDRRAVDPVGANANIKSRAASPKASTS